MKRDSVVELITEIYVDVNYNDVSYVVTKKHDVVEMISIKTGGYMEIMGVLEHHIHPRYTRVIIDDGKSIRILGDWIDKRYNFKMLNHDIRNITNQETLVELVEVRNATREDIKKWEEIIDKLKGEVK